MNEAVLQMLKKYRSQTADEYRNALKEIIQELALFGLWRTKFFEHAAFYGGTALRIIHGIDRYSEDLDFTLITPSKSFNLKNYEAGIMRELQAFGFSLETEVKKQPKAATVQTATYQESAIELLLKVGMPDVHLAAFKAGEQIRVKFEVNTNPPLNFKTEAVPIFTPFPFSIRTYTLPDLFAGKMAALLYRQWHKRVKGRDWYDFLWLTGRKTPLSLSHLQTRLEHIEKWDPLQPLELSNVQELLHQKIDQLDLTLAKQDLFPFLKDPKILDGWTKDLFHKATDQLVATPT